MQADQWEVGFLRSYVRLLIIPHLVAEEEGANRNTS